MTVLLCCYHVGHHVRQASSGTFHWRRHLIKRMTEARSIAAIRAIGPNRSCIIVRKKKLLNSSFCDQSMCQSMHFGKGAAVNNHRRKPCSSKIHWRRFEMENWKVKNRSHGHCNAQSRAYLLEGAGAAGAWPLKGSNLASRWQPGKISGDNMNQQTAIWEFQVLIVKLHNVLFCHLNGSRQLMYVACFPQATWFTCSLNSQQFLIRAARLAHIQDFWKSTAWYICIIGI